MFLFSLIIGLGASAALLRLALVTAEEQRIRRLLQGLVILLFALAGARLAFILTHTTYYATRNNEMWDLSAGGLWWPGAAAGGLLTVLVIGLAKHNGAMHSFDRFSVFLLPVAISFWLAAWSGGVAYGARVDHSVWWGMPMLDLSGVSAPRVPLQPAAALSLLLLLGSIEWAWRKPAPAGRRMGVLLFVLSVHSLLFSLMRADPVQPLFGVRLDVWASILLVVISGILLASTFAVKSKKDQVEKEPDQ